MGVRETSGRRSLAAVVVTAMLLSACSDGESTTAAGGPAAAGVGGAPAAGASGAPTAGGDPAGAAGQPAAGAAAATAPASNAGQGGMGGAPATPAAGAAEPAAGAAGMEPGPGTTPPAAGAAGMDPATPPPEDTTPASSFPPVTDLTAAGPFTPTSIPSGGPSNGYTIFHPQELGQDGVKHPIMTWGNGATTVPALFALLPHLSSHGFVIIASNNPFVTGAEMLAGIDWLFAENERDGSMFFEKLDTENVASFGYSLGSLGTFEIADDPRFTTTVHISGGAMDKSVVPNLRNPTAFFCGNDSDIAHANCESDFDLATVPVFYGVFPGDHLGILASHTVPINEVVTGWFRWRLMHDATLEDMFVGPDCSVCKDPGWTVKQKDFDVAP